MAISKSGLPQKVLELFDPRDDLEFKRPIRKKRPPALPFIGLGPFVEFFPKPGDPEYQPEQPALATSEERKFRSKEYSAQVSINEPSVLERCAPQNSVAALRGSLATMRSTCSPLFCASCLYTPGVVVVPAVDSVSLPPAQPGRLGGSGGSVSQATSEAAARALPSNNVARTAHMSQRSLP